MHILTHVIIWLTTAVRLGGANVVRALHMLCWVYDDAHSEVLFEIIVAKAL